MYVCMYDCVVNVQESHTLCHIVTLVSYQFIAILACTSMDLLLCLFLLLLLATVALYCYCIPMS